MVEGETYRPAQLGFWAYVIDGFSGDDFTFPDPVMAAVGYYQPPPPSKRHRRSGKLLKSLGASGSAHRPSTAPSAPSPASNGSAFPSARARASPTPPPSRTPASSPAPPRPAFGGRSHLPPFAGSEAAPESPLFSPARDDVDQSGPPTDRKALVVEVASLQRQVRRLEAEATRLMDSKHNRAGMASSVTTTSDGMPHSPGTAAAAARKLRQQAAEYRALLQSRARQLAAIDKRLAPVDTGGLAAAIEAERRQQEARRYAHQQRVQQLRQQADEDYTRKVKAVERKNAKDKERRQYMARFVQAERAAARAKAMEQQRKSDAKARRDEARAAARQTRYEQKQAAKELRRQQELEAQKR